MFYLALTFGLTEDPPGAVARMAGLIEHTAHGHGVPHPLQRALHPDTAFLREVGEETRLIVSEPLGNLRGAWHEVPENSYGVVQPGEDVLHPFQPLG